MKQLSKIKSKFKLLIIIISVFFIIIYTIIKLNVKTETKKSEIQNYMIKKSNEELQQEKINEYNKAREDLISNCTSNENFIFNDELNENEFYDNEIKNKALNNNNQDLDNTTVGKNLDTSSNQSLIQNQLQAELQNNTSDTKKKISNGVYIEYLDINNKKMISVPEKIYGEINETYNVENLDKQIKDYTLVSVEGEKKGKLKLEKINIQYKYAKISKINIKYIDRGNGNEITSMDVIEGYEGKLITINEKIISGYTYESGAISEKMLAGEHELKIYYTKNVEKNKEEQNSINQENSKENTEEQKKKEDDNKNEKNQCTINIKYVDIDNDQILYQEKVTGEKESKVKIKLKEIEGYNLITDSYDDGSDNNINIIDELINSMIDSEEDKGDNLKNKKTVINNSNVNNMNEKNSKSNDNKDISQNNNNILENKKINNVKTEYEIVMNCDDSDYIIYYKK